MNILITGGAGFIGSHLIEQLLENYDENLKIVVLDNLSTGKLSNLPEDKRIIFKQGDVSDLQMIESLKEEFVSFDYIYHLAAVASVALSMEDPIATHKANFVGTLNILNTFKNSGVKKLVYASSAAVYGDTKEIPTTENASKNPLSPYGADKLSGEYYLKVFSESFGIPSVACRFFNVFGERQDPSSPYSGVISIFFNRVVAKLSGEKTEINIYGDGKQVRDFIYVKDITRALEFLAKSEEISGEVFNLGYGKETSIKELAHQIKDMVCDIGINFLEGRSGDIKESRADVSKILSTGFEFKYSFKEGLKRLRDSLV